MARIPVTTCSAIPHTGTPLASRVYRPSLKYRPEIDGLRALAVLAVVFFHASIPRFTGGFVGVDVFFVISGYLITSLISTEIEAGTFTLASFYERRARRIFPALFTVVAFSALIAAIVLTPQDLAGFGKSVLGVACFANNIVFRHQLANTGYFSPGAESYVLLHTWSLAIEEQFYLVFPGVFLLLTRSAKKHTSKVLFVLAAISFAIGMWELRRSPESAFFGIGSRAWELLAGSLLAVTRTYPLRLRLLRELAGLAGLGLILYAVCAFTKRTPFPGRHALYPCLGTWLIIYASQQGASLARSALSMRPLVFVGSISYSLYLWHWPLLVFARYMAAGPLDAAATVLVILVSSGAAVLSYRYVESPFRGAKSPIRRRQVIQFSVASFAVLIAAGATLIYTEGLPSRYSDKTRELIALNEGRKTDYEEVCSNWRTNVHSVSDIHFCSLQGDAAHKVMFWGDSQVQQLYPVIRKIAAAGGFQHKAILFAIAQGCLPAEHLNWIDSGSHCDSFTHYAMQRALESDIDTVFIGFSTYWALSKDLCQSMEGACVARISPSEQRRRFFAELSARVHTLKLLGKRVIICVPFPIYYKFIPDLEARKAAFTRFGYSVEAKDVSLPKITSEVASVATSAGAELFDPRSSLCPGQHCITQLGGVSIYKDDIHLAASQAGILEAGLEKVFQPAALR